MSFNRTRASVGRTSLCAAIAALSGIALTAPGAAAKRITIDKPVNALIPNAVGDPPFARVGVLNSTIEVGRLGKAKRIRDVNVTVQTLGTGGLHPARELEARLIAPSSAAAQLFFLLDGFSGAPTPSIGPLTLDDEARLNLGVGNPINPNFLYQPWAGSAAPFPILRNSPLATLDNGPARGTWTLRITDHFAEGRSNLVFWRLTARTGRPFRTK